MIIGIIAPIGAESSGPQASLGAELNRPDLRVLECAALREPNEFDLLTALSTETVMMNRLVRSTNDE